MARRAVLRACRALTLAALAALPSIVAVSASARSAGAQLGQAVSGQARSSQTTSRQNTAPDPFATPPTLTRSVLRESSARMLLVGRAREATRQSKQMAHLRLRLNLQARRGDHVAVFIGLDRGRTAFEFPGLGAAVPLALDGALVYGSTVDGRIRLDWNGRWSAELQFPSTIRSALGRIHFQAASLRELDGDMTLLLSDPLSIDLVQTAINPIQRLLPGAALPNPTWMPATDPTPDFFVDPFGNRISRSRNLP